MEVCLAGVNDNDSPRLHVCVVIQFQLALFLDCFFNLSFQTHWLSCGSWKSREISSARRFASTNRLWWFDCDWSIWENVLFWWVKIKKNMKKRINQLDKKKINILYIFLFFFFCRRDIERWGKWKNKYRPNQEARYMINLFVIDGCKDYLLQSV